MLVEPPLIERMGRLNDLLGVIPAPPVERLSLVALLELPSLRARAAAILNPNRERWNAFLASRNDLESEPLVSGTVAFRKQLTGVRSPGAVPFSGSPVQRTLHANPGSL